MGGLAKPELLAESGEQTATNTTEVVKDDEVSAHPPDAATAVKIQVEPSERLKPSARVELPAASESAGEVKSSQEGQVGESSQSAASKAGLSSQITAECRRLKR